MMMMIPWKLVWSLKNYNFNTAIMKEWMYLYQGKFSIDLEDQVMMICFLTFMMEQQWMTTKVLWQLKAWVVL
jgi:hypothetical protein